ncbi:MAG: NAD-dependent epimerase, partial [Candidatus Taylorbacteria bacterium]|nr:NAD-dependent epimerase [Candidatus Taylorbacteria bacterium]
AFLLVAISSKTAGQLCNCGSGQSVEFKKMAELVVKKVGSGNIEYVSWPENYEKEETGDFETDISKIQKATGWKPEIKLEEGIGRMCAYYKKNSKEYIDE